MEYLIGVLVALLGGFFYQKSKRQTAEARNENIETKEKLNVIDKDISKNEGQVAAEEAKQSELKKELENAKASDSSLATIIDFLSKK